MNAAQLVIRLQCGRPGLDPVVGKIPWRRQRLLTPIFWSGKFHGLQNSMDLCKEIQPVHPKGNQS